MTEGRNPATGAAGTEFVEADPWRLAAAKEYYETDPEAVEWPCSRATPSMNRVEV
jgi:hypothetical protein